jgi:glycine/D-amino acid oxidase-like deaminating enzyme
MIYCEVPAPDAAAWSGTPAIVSFGTDDGAWLVPPVVGTPLKLSAASACRVVAEIGDSTTPPYWRDHLLEAFAALIPGFHADRMIGTRDAYYLSRASTGGVLLAVLADHVVSYAACGGSSFKFAPLIARSIAERITGADPAPTGLHSLDGGIVRAPSQDAPGQAPQPVSTEPAA